jgi:osmotically-inducible protein OsmY
MMTPLAEEKDSQLEAEVKRVLDEKGQDFSIMAIAKQGYVHLCGFVTTTGIKKEIGSMVESIPGVHIVTNHVRIRSWEEKRDAVHF